MTDAVGPQTSFTITADSERQLAHLASAGEHVSGVTHDLFGHYLDHIVVHLEANLRREFEPHDRTGATMDTMDSHAEGLDRIITIGGGAPFVEYGHGDIYPVNAQVLHWFELDGSEVFATHVGPVAADDFVGRAVHAVDLTAALHGLLAGIRTDLTGHEGAHA